MRELALFAGAGGGILGGKLLGWRTVCAVEIAAYCRRVLLARQRDGWLEPFPIWDDVRTFDGRLWRGHVDVVSGGFPCQDISIAGKGAGLDGERSGLWCEMRRIIREVQPAYAWLENSPMLLVRGLDRILADLAEMGFDARWGVLGASEAGACHERKRAWVLAYAHGLDWRERWPELALWKRQPAPVQCSGEIADPDGTRQQQPQGRERDEWRRPCNGIAKDADADRSGREEQRWAVANGAEHFAAQRRDWWATEPGVVRMVHGLANRVDRITALGNGQVPQQAALAWELLSSNL